MKEDKYAVKADLSGGLKPMFVDFSDEFSNLLKEKLELSFKLTPLNFVSEYGKKCYYTVDETLRGEDLTEKVNTLLLTKDLSIFKKEINRLLRIFNDTYQYNINTSSLIIKHMNCYLPDHEIETTPKLGYLFLVVKEDGRVVLESEMAYDFQRYEDDYED
jgi:hypothetical protein